VRSRSLQNRFYNTPLVRWISCHGCHVRRIDMKALARYQLILLGKQRHVGVNNLPKVVARQCRGRELNPRPPDHESHTLATTPPSRRRSKTGPAVAGGSHQPNSLGHSSSSSMCICLYTAIILTPTRELAMQIGRECRKFTKALELHVVCVYGGTGISEQIAELKRGAEVIVCTPGRMIDMLAANSGMILAACLSF